MDIPHEGFADVPGGRVRYHVAGAEERGTPLLVLDRVHILGQSRGTMLAVEYMLTHRPDGVESLVLSAPCLSTSRWAADGRRYLRALPDDHREAILRAEDAGSYDGPAYQEAMTAYYRRHVCRTDPWPACLMRASSA